MTVTKVGDAVVAIVVAMVGLYCVLLAVAVIDWGFLKGQITAYAIDCKKVTTDIVGCKTVGVPLNKVTYNPLPERQEVVYWAHGFPPERLTQCAIRDRRNWSCKAKDGSTEFGFTGGEYWQITPGAGGMVSFSKTTIHVSRWDWLNAVCGKGLMAFLVCALLDAWDE